MQFNWTFKFKMNSKVFKIKNWQKKSKQEKFNYRQRRMQNNLNFGMPK